MSSLRMSRAPLNSKCDSTHIPTPSAIPTQLPMLPSTVHAPKIAIVQALNDAVDAQRLIALPRFRAAAICSRCCGDGAVTVGDARCANGGGCVIVILILSAHDDEVLIDQPPDGCVAAKS